MYLALTPQSLLEPMATQEAKSIKRITNFYNCFSFRMQSLEFQVISGLAFHAAGHKLSFSFKQLNLLHSEFTQCPKPRLPYVPPPPPPSLSLWPVDVWSSWLVEMVKNWNAGPELGPTLFETNTVP